MRAKDRGQQAQTELLHVTRDRLLGFGKTILPETLTPALEEDAAKLIADNNFAFILAVALDRGTKTEIIWTIPFWIKNQLGHLNPEQLSQMTTEQLADVLERLPKRLRYTKDAPQTVIELARIVTRECGGDAELIWRGRKAQEVKDFLKRIHGIGEGIASMAVILLNRCRGIRFPDLGAMNVKPDVHVQRVLFRLGIASIMSEKEALSAAVRLNPDYPGALDSPLWVIGRKWCRETSPDCVNCEMNRICVKKGL